MRTLLYFIVYAFCKLGPIYFIMHLLHESQTTVCPLLTGSYHKDYFWFLDFMDEKHYRHQRFSAYRYAREMDIFNEFEKIMKSIKNGA